jgi:chromosome segregation ATPase
MAVWLPVLKAALPYVSNIVAAALPAFTRRKDDEATGELITQQITELQAAVTNNAETVKTLAAQFEKTLSALEASEAEMAERLTEKMTQRIGQQLASLHESLARCENTANLAQAQVSRLEGVNAALLKRIETLELQLQRLPAKPRGQEMLIAALAIAALLLAGLGLLY